MLVCNLTSPLGEIWKRPPYTEGKEMSKKEADIIQIGRWQV